MIRDFGIAEEKKEIKPVSGSSPEDGRIYMMGGNTLIVVEIHYNHESSDNADGKVRTLILNDILREDQEKEGEA